MVFGHLDGPDIKYPPMGHTKKDFHEYFLKKERLLNVLPYQMKVLTEDELVQKYNSYLPIDIKTFDDLLKFTNINKEDLKVDTFLQQDIFTKEYP